MSPKLNNLAIVGLAGLLSLCSQPVGAVESPANAGHTAEPSEARLRLNIFGLSFHTDRNAGYNEVNPGVGLRYELWRPAPRWSFFGDTSIYYDSSREWAKYAGLGTYYELSASWRFGASIVYAQSQSYNKGKPFFAMVPGVGFEYRRVLVNMVVLPSEDASSKISGLAVFLSIPLRPRD
jgi:hypothetical protein